MMLNEWKMEKPRLLISVTGGAKNFDANLKVRNFLEQGLVKAAENTGMTVDLIIALIIFDHNVLNYHSCQ